jgi:hypothetical protein
MKIFNFINSSFDDELVYYLRFFQFKIAEIEMCLFQFFYNYNPDEYFSPWFNFNFNVLSLDYIFQIDISFKAISIGISILPSS